MLIQLKNIYKVYNENKPNAVTALQGIDLSIDKGDMCSIAGPSGSGKSTLLNVIGCMDSFSDGEYVLDGEPIRKLDDKRISKIRNKKIGFVLQDFGLIRDRSVMENVSIPLYFSNEPLRSISTKVRKTLERLRIDQYANRRITELSGGQRQRVAIARAIVMNPDVILADEPTGALDTNTAKEMVDVLEALNNEGTTVIIVTHNPDVAERCNHRYSLIDGRIIKSN